MKKFFFLDQILHFQSINMSSMIAKSVQNYETKNSDLNKKIQTMKEMLENNDLDTFDNPVFNSIDEIYLNQTNDFAAADYIERCNDFIDGEVENIRITRNCKKNIQNLRREYLQFLLTRDHQKMLQTVLNHGFCGRLVFEEEQEIIKKVQSLLDKVNEAKGKVNKIEASKVLFKYLSEPLPKVFMFKHKRFENTVRRKLIEWRDIENLKEATEWLEELFE